jgi:hypothetical protein
MRFSELRGATTGAAGFAISSEKSWKRTTGGSSVPGCLFVASTNTHGSDPWRAGGFLNIAKQPLFEKSGAKTLAPLSYRIASVR